MQSPPLPFWDFRHPIKQIANKYLATYRDCFPNEVNLSALEYAVNSALRDITEAGYTVFADGSEFKVQSVELDLPEDAQAVTVRFSGYED